MKLGEIKGKRQLKVLGKLMTLADTLSEDESFKAFMDMFRDDKTRETSLFKLGPLLLRDDVADGIVEVVAYANGIEPEEVSDPVREIMELLTSDVELPAFLSGQQ